MKKTESGLPSLNREEASEFIQKWKTLPHPKKGILMLGAIGVGKSTLFKDEFKGTHKDGRTYNGFVTAHDIVKAFNRLGINEFMNEFRNVACPKIECVDDIGTEIVGNYYGSKLDVIEYLIQEWYSKGYKPCFTTNLNPSELTQRYGARVFDRLKEMCYIVVLEDTNLRSTDYFEDVQTLMNN
jgi:DNA replication protein DnaC